MQIVSSLGICCALVAGLTTNLIACSPDGGIARPPAAAKLVELHQAAWGGSFVLPEVRELAAARALLLETVIDDPADRDRLGQAWQQLGMELQDAGPGLVILREAAAARHGRGFYLLRKRGDLRLIMQAPHTAFEADTGLLALELMLESRAAAAMLNTVGRKQCDLTHSEGTYLQAFTSELATQAPVLVQLHGFSPGKRKTPAAAELEAIVSDGTRSPSACVSELVQRLQASGIRAGLFPRDVSELGATTNVQGRLLRGLGSGILVHIELSRPLRRRLVGDQALRAELVQVLESCLEQPQR